jgi:hypothetical protein
MAGRYRDPVKYSYSKIIIEVPKITKMDAFSLFQSKTSLFHDERASFTLFTAGLKQLMKQQHSPKSKPPSSKQKQWPTNTHTDNQNKERPTHSKFKFQIQIARKTHEVVSGAKKITPRLTIWVYVDSDAVRLYRASKASCWHAGVCCWLRQQWVHAEVCKSVWQSSKFNYWFNFWNYKVKI